MVDLMSVNFKFLVRSFDSDFWEKFIKYDKMRKTRIFWGSKYWFALNFSAVQIDVWMSWNCHVLSLRKQTHPFFFFKHWKTRSRSIVFFPNYPNISAELIFSWTGSDDRVFHNSCQVDNVVNVAIQSFSQQPKIIYPSVTQTGFQGPNALPTELTWYYMLVLDFNILYSHALLILAKSSKSIKLGNPWTNSQFNDPLTSTYQVSSDG